MLKWIRYQLAIYCLIIFAITIPYRYLQPPTLTHSHTYTDKHNLIMARATSLISPWVVPFFNRSNSNACIKHHGSTKIYFCSPNPILSPFRQIRITQEQQSTKPDFLLSSVISSWNHFKVFLSPTTRSTMFGF